MGRELTALALVAVLLVSVVGIGVATTVNQSGATLQASNDTTATISVSGDGDVTAEPDRALVFVSVSATGPNASAAADQLANQTAAFREAVTASDSVESVTTTDFQVFERRENGTTSSFARQSFELRVNDTGAVGDVVDTAVAGGATEVNSVQFTLSDERRQQLRATAIDRAVADARTQAEATAASTNLEISGIASVSTIDQFQPVRESAAVGDSGTVIDESPVSVSVSVQITYAAEP